MFSPILEAIAAMAILGLLCMGPLDWEMQQHVAYKYDHTLLMKAQWLISAEALCTAKVSSSVWQAFEVDWKNTWPSLQSTIKRDGAHCDVDLRWQQNGREFKFHARFLAQQSLQSEVQS